MLVTGCNSGLGLETIRALALRGARVLATARTVEKARDACAGLKGDFLPLACELSEPASVRACVAAVKSGAAPLDAIVCNAGVMAIPKPQQKFGWELHLFTNHIGHFILMTGLLDRLAPAGRVVVTASNAHRRAPAAGIEFDNLSGERGYATDEGLRRLEAGQHPVHPRAGAAPRQRDADRQHAPPGRHLHRHHAHHPGPRRRWR